MLSSAKNIQCVFGSLKEFVVGGLKLHLYNGIFKYDREKPLVINSNIQVSVADTTFH